jgi:hypothetical protein
MAISVGILPHNSKERHCGEFQNSISWKSDGSLASLFESRQYETNQIE